MTTVLAGDIGGTKTLLALYRFEGSDGVLTCLRSQHYRSLDWPELAPMAQEFLAGETAEAGCFAVAGPVNNGRAQLTNLPWDLNQTRLGSRIGVEKVELVNDFAVLIYGLGHLQPSQVAVVKPGQGEAQAPLLVIGAGTGLGVAYGIPSPSGLVAVASEGAHGEFAARSQSEWDLRQWIANDLNLARVSTERVVSGTGLGHVARWLLATEAEASHSLHAISERWLNPSPGDGESDLPAAVARLASEGDPLALKALELWIDLYGSVCGDLALAGLCRGGIWLAGGTAAKLLPYLQAGQFSRAFLHKGRLGAVLNDVPITAITDPAIGLYSAACRARMLIA
jgi:glucokinase